MKEELLRNLAGVFDYIKQGTEFVKEQAPLFIQEFITYKIWVYSFWIVISVVISIICIVVFKKNLKSFKNEKNCFDNEAYLFMMFVSGLLFVTFVIVFCCCTEELMKAYFAPRYFLVDSLLSLGK